MNDTETAAFLRRKKPTHRPAPEKHTCHAVGCAINVPPKLVMCPKHWRMVPLALQREVWRHYRVGQELDKRPTFEYMVAQRAAVNAVAVAEGRKPLPPISINTKRYLNDAAADAKAARAGAPAP